MGGESTHLPELNPKPVLRIHFNDIGHPASAALLSLVDAARLLENAIKNVLRHLYQPYEGSKNPPTRSVTLILRSMDGVAYCSGLEIDPEHKEIHFNLGHIETILKQDAIRCRDEILGVVTHEMVHAWQYNCLGTAPGGLIEGIADYVRLRSGLAPPHWKPQSIPAPHSTTPPSSSGSKSDPSDAPEAQPSQLPKSGSSGEQVEKEKKNEPKWDAGYDKTAYFLDWLDKTYGNGIIARMNETMRTTKYEEKAFWTGLFGQNVDVLYKKYRETLAEANGATAKDSTIGSEL